MNSNTIDHEESKVESGSFTPLELEAIAKVSRTIDQLNEVLAEDEKSTIKLDWSAMHVTAVVAGPGANGGVVFD